MAKGLVEKGALMFKEMSVDDIKLSGKNPASRTTTGATEVLMQSIRKRGILQPLLVDENGVLVAGHRRLVCAKRLGWKTVPVRVVPVDDELFYEEGLSVRDLATMEILEFYLRGGHIKEGPAVRKIRALEELGGRALLERMLERRMSQAVYTTARSITTYLGMDTGDTVWMRRVVYWLVDGRRNGSARNALETHIKPGVLYAAIEADEDIQTLWVRESEAEMEKANG